MELAHHGHRKHLAQFFTPPSVAKLVAMGVVGNQFTPRVDGGLYKALDPASGSGVMMLSTAAFVEEQAGAKGLAQWSFTCVDLDATCALMSAAQFACTLSAYNLEVGELIVIQGNSLFPFECWEPIIHATRAGVISAPITRQDFKDAIQKIANESQVSLFENTQLAINE